MESMRDKWTDERLDDLNHRVGAGFERAAADLRAHRLETRTELATLRGEMKSEFDKVDARFDRVDGRFDKVDARFDRIEDRFDRIDDRFAATQRLLTQVGGTTIAALIGLIATQI
jgi:tetrahydromethanopterin S-methyltransferase subunit G